MIYITHSHEYDTGESWQQRVQQQLEEPILERPINLDAIFPDSNPHGLKKVQAPTDEE